MLHDIIEKNLEFYQKDLSNLCYCLCRNIYDAENLFQETCLKAIKNKEMYKADLPFDKWLFAICVNTFKDHCRKRKRENIIEFQSNEDKDSFLQNIPQCNNVNYDIYSDLYDAINTLPDKYQAVITLKYFKDYSEKDIAEIVHIPIGTVKSRLHKAKEILKSILSK